MRKKSIIILIIALAILAGGFYVVWYVIPDAYINNKNQEPETQVPTLFGKDDYQVVEKSDGIYIVVDKVGLTAKVPEGWMVKKEGSDIPEPTYWVNLNSLDALFLMCRSAVIKYPYSPQTVKLRNWEFLDPRFLRGLLSC